MASFKYRLGLGELTSKKDRLLNCLLAEFVGKYSPVYSFDWVGSTMVDRGTVSISELIVDINVRLSTSLINDGALCSASRRFNNRNFPSIRLDSTPVLVCKLVNRSASMSVCDTTTVGVNWASKLLNRLCCASAAGSVSNSCKSRWNCSC